MIKSTHSNPVSLKSFSFSSEEDSINVLIISFSMSDKSLYSSLNLLTAVSDNKSFGIFKDSPFSTFLLFKI